MTSEHDDPETDGEGRGRLVALPPRAAATPGQQASEARAAADAPVRAAEEGEALRLRLELLRQEHRDMDAAIGALQAQGGDPFTVKRLKAQKLRLKDRIARLEDQITPDIIA